ncbi:MAG: hypothetical protein ACTHLH_09135 [Solirubrobacterales bacterium]
MVLEEVFCELCGERLLFTKVTSNGGEYGYFITDEVQGLLSEEPPGELEKIPVDPKSSHFESGLNLELLVPEEGLEPPTRGL